MNKFYGILFLVWFLSGAIFASDNEIIDDIEIDNAEINYFEILPYEIIGIISKCLAVEDFIMFSQTSQPIRAITKSNNAHDWKTSVKIDDEWHRYFSIIVYEINNVAFPFVIIPGGTYMMGEENDQHKVIVEGPLLVQQTPMTQEQYLAITGQNPSYFQPEEDWKNLPVERVSVVDIMGDDGLIAKLEEQDLFGFRLPTEEEWEYFARAGTTTIYFWGDNEDQAGHYAWFLSNSDMKTHPVASKRPNAWRIYDTSGNVWEWTDSLWSENSQSRVIRGGSWRSRPRILRSAVRCDGSPGDRCNLGFRLLRTFTL